MTEPLNHQHFKMAAPGCGVICFRGTETPGVTEVILSERAAKVGAGLGITGGGFVECGEIDQQPVGFISLSAEEAYRECREENLGFEDIISLEDFCERAQLVSSFHVKAGDVNRVHSCTYFALRLTDDEWAKVMALPPSDERKGALISAKLDYVPVAGTRLEGASRFYHKHELRAFEDMAKLAAKGRLF